MEVRNRNRTRGATLLEFTLVGIPVIFIVISVFEVARGMWIYQTMAHAAREGARFAIVHGSTCGAPNSCLMTVADVAKVIERAGVGLDANQLTVSLASDCKLLDVDKMCQKAIEGTLQELKTGAKSILQFPPDEENVPGQVIEVAVRFPFRSAIAMFWPGAGPGSNFGVANVGASSREQIQF